MSTSPQIASGIAAPAENQRQPVHELHAVENDQTGAKAPSTELPASRPAAKVSTSSGFRRLVIPLTAIGVVVTLVAATSDRWNAWQGSAVVQVTNNAMVRAEMTRLSARVSGNVLRVGVSDFQRVKAGDLLLEIDPEDYEAAVAQVQANVTAAKAVLANLENQKALQRGVIAQAEAQRLSALARLEETLQERERQSVLLRGRVSTPQKVEQATSAYDTARATLTASEATIEAQRRQLDVLNGQEGVLAANLRAAEAALRAAELRLGHTRIVAPFDGVVGERHVQEGDYVNIGTQLIAVVPLPAVYVTANYKETQLTHVAPGQPVEITVDTFPDAVLRGRVARLSPASGSTFALLPPDNATGNFTKVVQRIPVRIEFDGGQPLVEQLRPGMSVVTHIRVKGAAGDATQTDRADGK